MTAECHSLVRGVDSGVAVFNALRKTAALLVGENDSDLFDDLALSDAQLNGGS